MANSDVTYARSGAAAAYQEFNGLTVANGGTVDTACDVDFSKCSIFKCTTAAASVALTPINVGTGRTVKIHVRSSATAPTVTFGTTTPTLNWMAAAPTAGAFANGKVTVVTLTNDGTEILGSFSTES